MACDTSLIFDASRDPPGQAVTSEIRLDQLIRYVAAEPGSQQEFLQKERRAAWTFLRALTEAQVIAYMCARNSCVPSRSIRRDRRTDFFG
jgi:hypothetical protein